MDNRAKQHIDQAQIWLSKYPENWGQLVDFIAMARQELREASAAVSVLERKLAEKEQPRETEKLEPLEEE